jgi:hypothetical protein
MDDVVPKPATDDSVEEQLDRLVSSVERTEDFLTKNLQFTEQFTQLTRIAETPTPAGGGGEHSSDSYCTGSDREPDGPAE